MLSDLHVHTNFSDGKNTPEEVVQAAIALGMDCLGFSDHSHSPQPGGDRWSMPLAKKGEYIEEIARLKRKYAGRIKILCGTEQDLYSDAPTDGYDYLIASLHFLLLPCEEEIYMPVDETPELYLPTVEKYFGRDIYALCEAYYAQLAAMPQLVPDASIIGHFDYITIFQEKLPLFDESHPRYIAAWKKAVDALLTMNIPFEINTGGISRGHRTTPYPAAPIREYILAHGGRLILSSDSHRVETLCYGFEKY